MASGYGLEEFIQDVRAVACKQLPSDQTLGSIGPSFQRLLNNSTFLQEKLDAMGSSGMKSASTPIQTTVLLFSHGASAAVSRMPAHPMIMEAYGHSTVSTKAAPNFNVTKLIRRVMRDVSLACGWFQKGQLVQGIMMRSNPAICTFQFSRRKGDLSLSSFTRTIWRKSVVRRGYLRDIQQPVQFEDNSRLQTIGLNSQFQVPRRRRSG